MNIIVIGDIMLDINYHAIVEKRANEADIPVYKIINTDYIFGGAANVVNNLHNVNQSNNLNNMTVELVSVIGNDTYGQQIKELFIYKNINHFLVVDNKRHTTQKHRIIYKNKIVSRHDVENTNDINDLISEQIYQHITSRTNIDCVVLSDYDKGILTSQLCQQIIQYCNQHNIPTFVDPKITNYTKYKHCFCFKPNLVEGQHIANNKNPQYIMNYIYEHIQCENIILTSGQNGIYVNNINNHITHTDTIPVVDVTGAGDLVLSIIVYFYLLKKDLIEAAHIANYIGGKSVQHIGNYPLSATDIEEYLSNKTVYNPTHYENSTIVHGHNIDKLKQLKQLYQHSNQTVVFTNGCFDILHSAHIKLLQFAKKQGDILIVGLNSDDSIKRFKGEKRPINSLDERTTILSLFDFVDHIVVFEQDTPMEILSILCPNIMVKGSDYKIENIIGKEYAKQIVLFDLVKNKSTTLIVNRILEH